MYTSHTDTVTVTNRVNMSTHVYMGTGSVNNRKSQRTALPTAGPGNVPSSHVKAEGKEFLIVKLPKLDVNYIQNGSPRRFTEHAHANYFALIYFLHFAKYYSPSSYMFKKYFLIIYYQLTNMTFLFSEPSLLSICAFFIVGTQV